MFTNKESRVTCRAEISSEKQGPVTSYQDLYFWKVQYRVV